MVVANTDIGTFLAVLGYLSSEVADGMVRVRLRKKNEFTWIIISINYYENDDMLVAVECPSPSCHHQHCFLSVVKHRQC